MAILLHFWEKDLLFKGALRKISGSAMVNPALIASPKLKKCKKRNKLLIMKLLDEVTALG